jgi:hypothetical protein
MATEDINFAGMGLQDLVKTVTKLTTKKDAALVIGGWLVENGTRVARTFAYKGTFAKTDPGCAPTFARSSAHVDWRDGQDLVQAEQSATEDGFNLRFHRIEADLDALNNDTKRLFNCMTAMRSNLADRLDDIRIELNLVNADIARLQECCDNRQEGPTLNTDLFPNAGKFRGVTHFFGRQVLVFDTPQGTFVLPKVNPPVDGPGDPRVKNVTGVAELLVRDRRFGRAFGRAGVTKKDLVANFGDLEVREGVKLEQVLEILPDGTKFSDGDALVKALAQREAAAIRSTGTVDDVLTVELGFEDVSDAGATPIERVESIPAPVRAGLIAIGVGTVGQLAAKSGPELSKELAGEGIQVDPGEAAAWGAAAQVMDLLR